jgi:hypothetical protein
VKTLVGCSTGKSLARTFEVAPEVVFLDAGPRAPSLRKYTARSHEQQAKS